MENLQIQTNPKVEAVFNNYPDAVQKKILNLRKLIVETAEDTEEITKLEDCLLYTSPSPRD